MRDRRRRRGLRARAEKVFVPSTAASDLYDRRSAAAYLKPAVGASWYEARSGAPAQDGMIGDARISLAAPTICAGG
jgi:hypothetical protein